MAFSRTTGLVRPCRAQGHQVATNKVWRNKIFQESGTGASWTSSTLGSIQTWMIMCAVNPGETVIRTRLQIHLTLGVENSNPAGTVTSQSILGGTRPLFGLYCNPSLPEDGPPPGLDSSGLDGFWLMSDMLTLSSQTRYEDSGGVLSVSGTYTPDAGTYDSKAQRGPGSIPTSVFLVWDISATPTPYYQANVVPLAGKWGWAFRCNVLVDTSPP